MPTDTFVCSTALPVLDSRSHYPGYFDTVSETHLYPIGRVWMKDLFSGYLMLGRGVDYYKCGHGGYVEQLDSCFMAFFVSTKKGR